MEKPKLRMIHNMARSGSTLICKCLGCMKDVFLLSEVHPLAWHLFNPLKQASEWFGLLAQDDVAELRQRGETTFTDAIALIQRRCVERGGTLVLRDWAHLDYTGYPFISTPSFRPLLYVELAKSFEILRVSTAREPIAQWQSLAQLGVMQEPLRSGVFGIDKFLAGYLKYAMLCVETGFVRYEELLANPESVMGKLCKSLVIDFDAEFIHKWHDYKTITGDVNNQRASNAFRTPPSRPVDGEVKKAFRANSDYHRVCELLGYHVVDA